MITREQVADLREGDVVRVAEMGARAEDTVTIQGPIRRGHNGHLILGGYTIAEPDGTPTKWGHTLTVVSRAPRLYVNHPRTEPVPGDVVSRGDRDGATWSRCPLRSGAYRWRNTANDEWYAAEDFLDFGNGLRLLVDGETGQVVP